MSPKFDLIKPPGLGGESKKGEKSPRSPDVVRQELEDAQESLTAFKAEIQKCKADYSKLKTSSSGASTETMSAASERLEAMVRGLSHKEGRVIDLKEELAELE